MKRHYLLIALLAAFVWGCQEHHGPQTAHPSAWETWATAASSQKGVDTDFRFNNLNPAYEEGTGPNVYIDEAHFNLHTAEGRFKPFAELLRADGYRVKRFRSRFSGENLKDCQILVIANPQAEVNLENTPQGEDPLVGDWRYPHPSAFAKEEINELISWVREGGSLFLIVDHAPFPGAAADLAVLLGIHMLDGYASSSKENRIGMDVFGRVLEEGWREYAQFSGKPLDDFRPALANPGTLAAHPVVEGRNFEERVDSVVTSSGQAFYASEDWEPILVFGPKAVCLIPLVFNFEDSRWADGPLFSVAGWLQGATRKLGQGRVAIFGETAMFSAQFDDISSNVPDGMNAPQASQNAQFCLNLVHWLSAALDAPQ